MSLNLTQNMIWWLNNEQLQTIYRQNRYGCCRSIKEIIKYYQSAALVLNTIFKIISASHKAETSRVSFSFVKLTQSFQYATFEWVYSETASFSQQATS